MTTITLSLDRIDDEIARNAATICRLESDLQTLRAEGSQLATFRELALKFGSPVISSIISVEGTPEEKKIPRAGSKSATITEGGIKALLASPQSHMSTADILAALKSTGLEIGGTNELMYLASVLSRDPRFVSERPHGWRIADQPSGKDEPQRPDLADEAIIIAPSYPFSGPISDTKPSGPEPAFEMREAPHDDAT